MRSFHWHGRDTGFPCLLGYNKLAYYVVMEHSTIFTEIGDVDMRSFHRNDRDTSFPCLLGYSNLVYYVGMEHSTIFTGISDMDTRFFHRQGRDTSFSCLLGYNKQEGPPVVDHYIYKHFTYSVKSTTDKQVSIFTKSFRNFYSKASKVFLKCFVKDHFYSSETFSEKASIL